jgi:hypothetical protein
LAVEPWLGFSFGRKGQPLLLDDGAVNTEFGVTCKGQPWTGVSIDIAGAEAGEVDVNGSMPSP